MPQRNHGAHVHRHRLEKFEQEVTDQIKGRASRAALLSEIGEPQAALSLDVVGM